MLALDARPLQNDHRFRGIGRYVGALAAALEKAEVAGWGVIAHPRRLDASLPKVPRIPSLRPSALQYHLGWAVDEIAIPITLRRHGFRVFHATDPNAVTDSRLITTVATVYDLTPLHDRRIWRALWPDQRLAYRRMVRNVRSADAIVTISQSVKAHILDELRVDESRVHVVYPPVNLPSEPLPPVATRRGVLHVGAPDPHKNVDVLVRAVARIDAKRRPPLTFVGPWPPSRISEIGNLAAHLGVNGLSFEPYASPQRVSELYRSAAVLAMPSSREGFGLPALEGLATGCAVVVSDIPALREVVGDAAVVVRAGAVDELAEAVDLLCSSTHERERMARAAIERAKVFNWSRSVDALLGCYTAVGVALPRRFA